MGRDLGVEEVGPVVVGVDLVAMSGVYPGVVVGPWSLWEGGVADEDQDHAELQFY